MKKFIDWIIRFWFGSWFVPNEVVKYTSLKEKIERLPEIQQQKIKARAGELAKEVVNELTKEPVWPFRSSTGAIGFAEAEQEFIDKVVVTKEKKAAKPKQSKKKKPARKKKAIQVGDEVYVLDSQASQLNLDKDKDKS